MGQLARSSERPAPNRASKLSLRKCGGPEVDRSLFLYEYKSHPWCLSSAHVYCSLSVLECRLRVVPEHKQPSQWGATKE